MAQWNMPFCEAIQFARSLIKSANEVTSSLDDYMDTMPLPEGTDTAKRLTVKIWVHHYWNGTCSLESLNNLLKSMGLERLLDMPPHEIEVDKDGHISIYKIKEEKQDAEIQF